MTPHAFSLPERLTRDEAPQWVSATEATLPQQANAPVHINAAPLQQFDSTALSAVLAVRRAAHARGLVFGGVLHMPAALQSLAQAYGVSELLAHDA